MNLVSSSLPTAASAFSNPAPTELTSPPLTGDAVDCNTAFASPRGGDVTYHGPNQLVGYPILDLRNFRQDVGWYVRSLEQTLIRAVSDFGIQGRRIEKLVGVWVDDAKIAQIGARIENWITYHGFALNVDPNMAHFDLIVPCGISDKAVTSMARVLDRQVAMHDVRQRVAARFAAVFDAELVNISREELDARLNELEPSAVMAH